MNNYIVTVETNFGREVICTLNDLEDSDHHFRRIEIASYIEACDWIENSMKEFPHATYHLYKLVESNLTEGGIDG